MWYVVFLSVVILLITSCWPPVPIDLVFVSFSSTMAGYPLTSITRCRTRTPGYGRPAAVKALLTVGADPTVKNKDGKTAKDLILEQPKNPLNGMPEILDAL